VERSSLAVWTHSRILGCVDMVIEPARIRVPVQPLAGSALDQLEESPFGEDYLEESSVTDEVETSEEALGEGTEAERNLVLSYFREIGEVSLLTPDDELRLGRQIERGHIRIGKALSRSPIVIEELVRLGRKLRQGELSPKELGTVRGLEPMPEQGLRVLRLQMIDQLERIGKTYRHLVRRFKNLKPRNGKLGWRPWRHGDAVRRWIGLSRLVRQIVLAKSLEAQLIEKVEWAKQELDRAESELKATERALPRSRQPSLRWKLKVQQQIARDHLRQLEKAYHVELVHPKTTLAYLATGRAEIDEAQRHLIEANLRLVTTWKVVAEKREIGENKG